MKDSIKSKIRITEGSSGSPGNEEFQDTTKQQREKLKKPIIFFLMTIVCAGCLYLIFKPNKDQVIAKNAGFNAVVPQAADDQLQSDKQKAYEQQLLEQKNEEKKKALTTLSDYWNDSSSSNNLNDKAFNLNSNAPSKNIGAANQSAVNSYQNTQQALSSFYGRDQQEVDNLRREISRLKNEASQKELLPRGVGINDQLELMEKSYQMATKYLPMPAQQEKAGVKETSEEVSGHHKGDITSVKQIRGSIVSSLYHEPSDSLFLERLHQNRFTGIQNEHSINFENRNSIRAVIHETKWMTAESTLSLRLLEPIIIGKVKIPPGTLLKAMGKFQGGRLQLKISVIEYNGFIKPVEINIHDNDGQLGLYIPYSPEQSTITDIVGNMGQNSGTNIMMTQSAGQQVAADLTRGIVQGISGYFQKKVRLPKVTIKAGHQVFLVSKNN
ncbi:Bacteroides conjugative transposon TraM protein [Chryseobacterium oleae]|uniref:Bacteroides conjugative transposon TraM protein n=1 Tax=Chryseobacterium oleae TaxID=491207 RepID=A0A1I4YZ22_CHROL|nr:conjugative transposon protein TraM [Chryseobacterium oleae]SFN43265.1 Bacteroides conjugative transposon TraM protein [Chryseobacterium oleae]